MNKFTTIFIFILSCAANNYNLLPQDFKVNFRADKINALQLFINDVKSNCKDREVRSECEKYFPLNTLNNLLNRYRSAQPQVNSYEKYYQLKKNIHDELQSMYNSSLGAVDHKRKKGKQRSNKEIAITQLSGQCLAVARKFQDQDDGISTVERKVQEFKRKEAEDNRRANEEVQEDNQQRISSSSSKSELSQEMSNQNSDEQVDQNVQQVKQVKRRRIVVLDILECEDCLKKGYVTLS